MNNKIKEGIECLIKMLVFMLIMIGAWLILGAIILNWNLPGFVNGIIGFTMLFCVPLFASWIIDKLNGWS